MSDFFKAINFLGHNCFSIETNESLLIIDPWFSRSGAFFGSWFQYPTNHHLLEGLFAKSLNKKLYIYITHEHQDHFDAETLGKFKKSSIFIIPKFDDDYLKNKIMDMGFSCIEISDCEEYALEMQFKIKVFISDVGINHDSAVLVSIDDITFFNQNDCKIFDRLNEVGRVNIYSVQFSGATWHPHCYENYSANKKMEIGKQKINAKLSNVLRGVQELKPDLFVPAAGPAIFPFLMPELSTGDGGNIFIHQDTLHEFLVSNGINSVIYPRPGDSVDWNSSRIPIGPPTSTIIGQYIKDIHNEWDHIKTKFEKNKLIKAVENRIDEIWDLEFPKIPIIIFRWGDGDEEGISIDLNKKNVSPVIEPLLEDFYEIAACEKYFSLMSMDEYRWQDIYLTMRAKVFRRPDVFNTIVNIFIFSDATNIRSSILRTKSISDEKCIIEDSFGNKYLINRYCPHQGADLSSAIVDSDSYLVCPRHSWKFNLKNSGKCIQADCSINAENIK